MTGHKGQYYSIPWAPAEVKIGDDINFSVVIKDQEIIDDGSIDLGYYFCRKWY